MFAMHHVWPKPSCKGTVKGGRRQGRRRKRWEDIIRELTGLIRQVQEGSGEQGKMEKTGRKINCGAPMTLAVKGLMMMMRELFPFLRVFGIDETF